MMFVQKSKPAPVEKVLGPTTPVVEVTPPTVQGHGDDDDDEVFPPTTPASVKAAAYIAPLVLFFISAAFALLLATSLSVPTTSNIALLRIAYRGHWAADLGVFGTCTRTKTVCSSPVVGYSAPPLVHVGGLGFLPCLSGALLVNPLAASFSGIAMLTLLAAWALDISGLRPAVLATLVLATFSSVLAFALNLAFILVTRAKVKSATDGEYTGHIGNAFWFSVAAMAALVLALRASSLLPRVPHVSILMADSTKHEIIGEGNERK